MYTSENNSSNCSATPCIDCGTTEGAIPRNQNRPRRIHGRCGRCDAAQRLEDSYGDRAPLCRPAEPCSECGTTGGRIPPRCYQPVRSFGMCERCYNAFMRHERGQARYRAHALPTTSPEPEEGDPTPAEIEAACQEFRADHPRLPVGHSPRLPRKLRIGGRR